MSYFIDRLKFFRKVCDRFANFDRSSSEQASRRGLHHYLLVLDD